MGFSALKYVDELVEAGVPEKQAKAQVLILQDFKDSELATKGDLAKTEAALKHDIALIQKDIVVSRYLTILGLPTVSGLVFAALKYLSMI